MNSKKLVVFNDKRDNTFVKTVIVKYSMPTNREFIKLFNSVVGKETIKEFQKIGNIQYLL